MSQRLHSARPAPQGWQSRGTDPASPGRRLAWLDILRGAALAGMVVYHGAWDLHAFGLIGTDPSREAGWHLFGQCVAGVFLALSGFGLSLAVRQGASPRAMALRLGRIAAAAALVSLVTRVVVPEAPIWFGILHCIVVTNAVALALRSWPGPVLLAVAAVAATAPALLRGIVGPAWAWTGLAAAEPATLDFRPVLPWLAPVLVGMVLGRTARAGSPPPVTLSLRALRPLAWAGRRSLLVYLAHQPLLVGALVVGLGTMPNRDSDMETLRNPEQAAAFLQRCRTACTARGGEPGLCSSTCHCVLTTAVAEAVPQPFGNLPIFGAAPRHLDAAVALCRPAPAQAGG